MRRGTSKILTVVGARPQFIKAAVVSRAVEKRNASHPNPVREVIVHTGQHYDADMSDVFFRELGLPDPAHHLGIGGGTHGAMTGQMLEAIERVIGLERPDWVLVYGDTNSTLAGALAAAKLHVSVAHVEAGLRSYNRRMPEEINRVMTDHLAQMLFVPTRQAAANLDKEGIRGASVRNVGDVMYDAALHYGRHARPTPQVAERLAELRGHFLLATIHRAENTDDPSRLASLIGGIEELSARIPVILPLHPRTRKSLVGWTPPPGLHVLGPVGYLDMVCLLDGCQGVLTDSGGLQKEAFFFRKSCLVLRDETEWVELVDEGFNALVGTDRQELLRRAGGFFGRKLEWSKTIFGDGSAGDQIVAALVDYA